MEDALLKWMIFEFYFRVSSLIEQSNGVASSFSMRLA
jgi:hypothetical protein